MSEFKMVLRFRLRVQDTNSGLSAKMETDSYTGKIQNFIVIWRMALINIIFVDNNGSN